MDSSSLAQFSKEYELDCKCLSCFVSGLHVNSQQNLVEILGRRSLEEIRLIRQLYRSLYNQDILHLLHNNQRVNKIARLAYLRMQESHERDSEIVRDTLLGSRVDRNTLIEIVCTRPSVELHAMKLAYRSRYNSDIEQDVSLKTSGTFKEILVAILRSSRSYGGNVNVSMAMCDAKTVYEAMESGKYVDQKTLISLMSQRSTGQFKAVLDAYKQLYGHEFSKSLKRNRCGEFGKELSVIIQCIQYPEKYFAKKLSKTVNNFDTQESLIRIVVTRSGIDLKDISYAFTAKTGGSLGSLVRREFNTSHSRSSTSTEKVNSLVVEILVELLRC